MQSKARLPFVNEVIHVGFREEALLATFLEEKTCAIAAEKTGDKT